MCIAHGTVEDAENLQSPGWRIVALEELGDIMQ